MKNLKPFTAKDVSVDIKVRGQIYNLSLALDYAMSFYKQNLYQKSKTLLSKISDKKDNQDAIANTIISIEKSYIKDNIEDSLRLLSEIQTMSTSIYKSYIANQDIRQSLIHTNLVLNILAQRHIMSKSNVETIVSAIKDIIASLEEIYNNNQNLSVINTDIENNTDTDEAYDIIKDIIIDDSSEVDVNNIKDMLDRETDIVVNNNLYKRTEKDKTIDNRISSSAYQNNKIITELRSIKDSKSSSQPIKDNFKNIKNIVSENSKDQDRHDSRKTMIMGVLKSGVMMSIKDISDYVPGCSEKTIQRDLNSLLESGLIKKTGEKRWSKYGV